MLLRSLGDDRGKRTVRAGATAVVVGVVGLFARVTRDPDHGLVLETAGSAARHLFAHGVGAWCGRATTAEGSISSSTSPPLAQGWHGRPAESVRQEGLSSTADPALSAR